MIDHIADKNLRVLNLISQLVELPTFVKSASINNIDNLPSDSFADSVSRLFPCHTRQDTWLSYAYFIKQANSASKDYFTKVSSKFDEFIRLWNLSSDCATIKQELQKQANGLDSLSDADFAIVQTYNGQLYRALPITDETTVAKAAEHLTIYRDKYPVAWRKEAAARILDKATKLKVTIDNPYITKAAGVNKLASAVDVAAHIMQRVLLAKKYELSDSQTAIVKYAKNIADSGTFNPTEVEQVVHLFDKGYSLTKEYNRGIPAPEEICYTATPKSASDATIRLTNGAIYGKDSLAKAGLAPFRVLGDDFVAAVTGPEMQLDMTKLASIATTLPLPDAKLLCSALAVAGIGKLK